MKRIAAFVYGVFCYVVFFGTFCYAMGFIGNLVVPKSIDSEPSTTFGMALMTNLALLGLFAVQHSIMARPAFKKVWTRVVPEPFERSTYVLFSSAALILLFWAWEPMGGTVWSLSDPMGKFVTYAIYFLGWGLVLASSFFINHFDLFGLRQVYLYLKGQKYTHLPFSKPAIYRYIRHPLYVGWFVVFWATPTMTVTHLVFAVATTAYILIAVRWEESDLSRFHGKAYENYMEEVPRFVPRVQFGRDGRRKVIPA